MVFILNFYIVNTGNQNETSRYFIFIDGNWHTDRVYFSVLLDNYDPARASTSLSFKLKIAGTHVFEN